MKRLFLCVIALGLLVLPAAAAQYGYNGEIPEEDWVSWKYYLTVQQHKTEEQLWVPEWDITESLESKLQGQKEKEYMALVRQVKEKIAEKRLFDEEDNLRPDVSEEIGKLLDDVVFAVEENVPKKSQKYARAWTALQAVRTRDMDLGFFCNALRSNLFSPPSNSKNRNPWWRVSLDIEYDYEDISGGRY